MVSLTCLSDLTCCQLEDSASCVVDNAVKGPSSLNVQSLDDGACLSFIDLVYRRRHGFLPIARR